MCPDGANLQHNEFSTGAMASGLSSDVISQNLKYLKQNNLLIYFHIFYNKIFKNSQKYFDILIFLCECD